MSKKKKHNKKQQKERLPAKEHYKFDTLLAVIIIYNMLFLASVWHNWFSVLVPDTLYFDNDFNLFLILCVIFNFIILVLYGNLHTFATDNKYQFKDYFRGTNKLTKEKAKKCFSKCGILFLVSIICFVLGLRYNIKEDNAKIIKSNIISEQTLFEYTEVEKIEISFSYERTSLKSFNYSCVPALKITAHNDIYELTFKGFSSDYLKLEKFLNKFNNEIIFIDTTNIEDVILADEEQQKAFNRIFK